MFGAKCFAVIHPCPSNFPWSDAGHTTPDAQGSDVAALATAELYAEAGAATASSMAGLPCFATHFDIGMRVLDILSDYALSNLPN